jgi:uncharacterized membrane protein
LLETVESGAVKPEEMSCRLSITFVPFLPYSNFHFCGIFLRNSHWGEIQMSASPALLQRGSRLRSSTFVFAFIGAMILYVLYHNERFLIDSTDAAWQHYQPFKWWLLPHGIAGACAILLGPMQFSDRLRQRFTKLHRVVGRVYVFGALIAAPLGAYIQYFEERMGGTRSFSVAAIVDAALLMLTTAIAFGFAWKRKIPQHRQWMTRSYAVAIVFLEVRVIAGLGGWDRNPAAIETIVWMCLPFSILLADIVLQIQELRRNRPIVAKAHAVAAG